MCRGQEIKCCEDCDHFTEDNTCEVTGETVHNKYERHDCPHFVDYYKEEDEEV